MLKSLFLGLAVGTLSVGSALAQDEMPQGGMQAGMEEGIGSQGQEAEMHDNLNAAGQGMNEAPVDLGTNAPIDNSAQGQSMGEGPMDNGMDALVDNNAQDQSMGEEPVDQGMDTPVDNAQDQNMAAPSSAKG